MRKVVLGWLLVGACWMAGAGVGCKDDSPASASGSPISSSKKDQPTYEHCG
jgi:hypothetical protein